MPVDAQDVINELLDQIRQLNLDLAVARVQAKASPPKPEDV